jgi:hypothetical protein
MVAELHEQQLFNSTLIIVSAQHGQWPIDNAKRAVESGGNGNDTVTDPLGSVNKADRTSTRCLPRSSTRTTAASR